MRNDGTGLRRTKQRRVILEEVKGVTTHPTADEVYEMVRHRLPHVSLGTVYRNLELLAGCGLIRQLEFAGSQRRFDGDTSDHHHVRCARCGRVDDIRGHLPCRVEEAFGPETGYRITGHRLEIMGMCPGCQKADEEGGGG